MLNGLRHILSNDVYQRSRIREMTAYKEDIKKLTKKGRIVKRFLWSERLPFGQSHLPFQGRALRVSPCSPPT